MRDDMLVIFRQTSHQRSHGERQPDHTGRSHAESSANPRTRRCRWAHDRSGPKTLHVPFEYSRRSTCTALVLKE